MCLIFSVLIALPAAVHGQSNIADSASIKPASTLQVAQIVPMPMLTVKTYSPTLPNVYLPPYTQGVFCNFEDKLNRKTPIRIDLSVK